MVKTAKGAQVVLDLNFKFDGAPDPKLGFGKNGYVKSTRAMTTRGKTSLAYSLRPTVIRGKLVAFLARVDTENPKGVIMNMQGFGTAMSVIALVAATVGAPVTVSAADHVLASGTFSGQSGHAASGGVSVVKTGKGVQVVLGPNFKFDGAPDPANRQEHPSLSRVPHRIFTYLVLPLL